jgi:hypothetical protein
VGLGPPGLRPLSAVAGGGPVSVTVAAGVCVVSDSIRLDVQPLADLALFD